MAKAETDLCKPRLLKYCQGQGLDLGCGNAKIKPDSIGIDLQNPVADMRRDARKLDYYPDSLFDYVYSSHLLEEIQDTEPTLKDWLRVIKPGGFLVLYQIIESRYFPIGSPNCNPSHKHHFTGAGLRAMIEGLGAEFVHYSDNPETKEWSFELVMKKLPSEQIPEVIPASPAPIEQEPSELTTQDLGISLLIPTLTRPKSMRDFAEAVDATTKDKTGVEIIFGVHSEDTVSIEEGAKLATALAVSVRVEIIDRYPDGKTHLTALWNQLYPRAKHSIIGYFGDDVLFKTPEWDVEVRKEFEKDKHILVACNDVHVQRGRQAVLFFTHKATHKKLGFYLPPMFRRWYMDTFLDVVYRNAGKLHYREDIVTEHLHADVFPERRDDVYRALGSHTAPGGLKDEDKALWLGETNREELKRCMAILKSTV